MELKDGLFIRDITEVIGVPNAPCGVERGIVIEDLQNARFVPNAPCGVERGYFTR